MNAILERLDSTESATHYDEATEILVTTMPDGVTFGWDTCGGCNRSLRICECTVIRVPAVVVWMRMRTVEWTPEKTAPEPVGRPVTAGGGPGTPVPDKPRRRALKRSARLGKKGG